MKSNLTTVKWILQDIYVYNEIKILSVTWKKIGSFSTKFPVSR